ncbi:MAG: phosphoglucosamine mutase, partial [Acidobacteriota bacterium]
MGTLFGTDGIRGKAGEPPLDDDNLLRLGRAIGRVLGRSGRGTPRVVIGRDTRESGPGILRELAEGLKQQGAAVRSAGVVPTPAVSLLARSDSFDAGIAISASHNPYQDNGLKIFGNEGGKLPDELEAAIESELAAMGDVERMGSPAPVDEPTLRSRHREWLRDRAQSWGLDLSGRKLVVDAAHGAAAEAAAQLFSELGAEVESLGDSPTGTNINDGRGSLYPDELGVRVRSVGAELGI